MSSNEYISHNSIKNGELLLMIPGFFNARTFPANVEDKIGNLLNRKIQETAELEFDGDNLKKNFRATLCSGIIPCRDLNIDQEVIINLLVNEHSSYCILELFIPNIKIATHKLLESYCANSLDIVLNGQVTTIDKYMESIGMEHYGDKRSMVFVNEEINEQSLINLLANEANPMGTIMGEHFKYIATKNLAQYDVARVYACELTMIEIVKNPLSTLEERICSQAIEVFFVEMLLLQDAAISRINNRIKKIFKEEQSRPFNSKAKDEMDKIASEMIYVYDFADYKQFHFPTVRVSAENIAKALGIAAIENKVQQSQNIIKQTIENNERKLEKKENAIKNVLLIVLTLVSGINTIAIVLDSIFDHITLVYAYYIAFGVIGAGIFSFIILRLIVKITSKG